MFNKLKQCTDKETTINDKATKLSSAAWIVFVVFFYQYYFFIDRVPWRILQSLLVLSVILFVGSIVVNISAGKWFHLNHKILNHQKQQRELRKEIKVMRDNAKMISSENAEMYYGIKPKEQKPNKSNKKNNKIIQMPRH